MELVLVKLGLSDLADQELTRLNAQQHLPATSSQYPRKKKSEERSPQMLFNDSMEVSPELLHFESPNSKSRSKHFQSSTQKSCSSSPELHTSSLDVTDSIATAVERQISPNASPISSSQKSTSHVPPESPVSSQGSSSRSLRSCLEAFRRRKSRRLTNNENDTVSPSFSHSNSGRHEGLPETKNDIALKSSTNTSATTLSDNPTNHPVSSFKKKLQKFAFVDKEESLTEPQTSDCTVANVRPVACSTQQVSGKRKWIDDTSTEDSGNFSLSFVSAEQPVTREIDVQNNRKGPNNISSAAVASLQTALFSIDDDDINLDF